MNENMTRMEVERFVQYAHDHAKNVQVDFAWAFEHMRAKKGREPEMEELADFIATIRTMVAVSTLERLQGLSESMHGALANERG